ncbi:MAG: metallophosphoesterase [Gammaproteobacteria bacterium]|jgi:hypothetical protein
MLKPLQEIIQETENLTECNKKNKKFIHNKNIKFFFEKIAKSNLFKFTHKFPEKCNDAKSLYDQCKEKYNNSKMPSSMTLQHTTKPKNLKHYNKITTTFRTSFHVSDTHGEFDTSIKAIKNCFDENGCLLKNLVIINHGDMIDRGERSIANLIFWLKLKQQYPNQIVLLRGNHEHKGTYNCYGSSWQNKFKKCDVTPHLDKIFNQLPIYDLNMIPDKNNELKVLLSAHGGPQSCKTTKTSFKKICGSEVNPNSYADNPLWNEATFAYGLGLPIDQDKDLDGKANKSRGGVGVYIGKSTKQQLLKHGISKVCVGHSHKDSSKTFLKEYLNIIITTQDKQYKNPVIGMMTTNGFKIYPIGEIPTHSEIKKMIEETDECIKKSKKKIEKKSEIKSGKKQPHSDKGKPTTPKPKQPKKSKYNVWQYLCKNIFCPLFYSLTGNYFLHAVNLHYNKTYKKNFNQSTFFYRNRKKSSKNHNHAEKPNQKYT